MRAQRSWIEKLREAGIPSVGVAFGLTADASGRAWGPCPACGAEQRGSKDRRRPLRASVDGICWRCFRCGAAGDAAALARVVQEVITDPERLRELRVRGAQHVKAHSYPALARATLAALAAPRARA